MQEKKIVKSKWDDKLNVLPWSHRWFRRAFGSPCWEKPRWSSFWCPYSCNEIVKTLGIVGNRFRRETYWSGYVKEKEVEVEQHNKSWSKLSRACLFDAYQSRLEPWLIKYRNNLTYFVLFYVRFEFLGS